MYDCVASSFLCEGFPHFAASGGQSSSRCTGLSLSRTLSLRSTGSRRAGSATVAHGPSRSVARGILPDQGSNPCPLHWQADSQPLRPQGSPEVDYFEVYISVFFSIVAELCNHFQNLRLLLTSPQNSSTRSLSPYAPYPQATTNPLCASVDLSTLDVSYKWNHTLCCLCEWLFSFSMMFSRLIYIVACISTLFLLIAA